MTGASAHLLVVDCDAELRALLRRFLAHNGYLVSVARDAAHARRLLDGLAFDLLIVEAAMPGEDGRAFARALRGRTPVLLLLPRDALPGDDGLACLPKPFEPRALLQRVGELLRRAAVRPRQAPPRTLTLGAARYDIARGELWRDGAIVHLTASEDALMRLLAEASATPISRALLVAGLGGVAGTASERAVDVQITRLRRKIETDPHSPRYLQTVRGEGYMLTPD